MGIVTKLEDEFDGDLVDDFITHYSIMVYQMENLIIGLEQEEKYENNINELFRIAHNIKSSSGYFKIKEVNKLSVLLEDILEEARKVNGQADKLFVDWCLMVYDQFDLYKEDLEEDLDSFSELNKSIIHIPSVFIR